MKRSFLIVVLVLLPVMAFAGDIKTTVRKDSIIVSPMDPQGVVILSGPPGCVLGMFPIQITARNKETDITVPGAVAPDGSFSLCIQAGPKDSIKLIFMGANGKDKKVKVKVPKAVFAAQPPLIEHRVEQTTTIVPVDEPVEQVPPAIGTDAPGTSEVIRQEDELKASGVIE